MGWFSLFLCLSIFGLLVFILYFVEYMQEASQDQAERMGKRLKTLGFLVIASVVFTLVSYPQNPLYQYFSGNKTEKPQSVLSPPQRQRVREIAGLNLAGLRLGLQGKSYMPLKMPSSIPQIDFLERTQGGRSVVYRYIGVFTAPEAYDFRRQGANFYFEYRYGIKDALNQPFTPQVIIVHSTEGESEAGAFLTFNRNSSYQYLGGAWTHFSVDTDGKIYQYGPLNRISKGQTGIDDYAIGIELVGQASLWHPNGEQRKIGTLIERFKNRRHPQFLAALDLIKTLKSHYRIPLERIYSHEDIGHIGVRNSPFPDYHWLRTHIRDKVYLSAQPDVVEGRKPTHRFPFLEPYDRYDPGRDVMKIIYQYLGKTLP